MRRCAYCAVVIATVALVGVQSRVLAQDDPVMPPATAALFEHIDDLDKMRILNPVQFTAAQLDKIIPVVKQRQIAYNRRIVELAVEPLKKIATEIEQTRAALLKGGSVPKDLDTKITALQKQFREQRQVEQDKTLKLLADAIRPTLTAAQYRTIIDMARRDFPTGDGNDEQFYNLWIRETIIAYGRIVPLLEDMRKARAGQTASPAAP